MASLEIRQFFDARRDCFGLVALWVAQDAPEEVKGTLLQIINAVELIVASKELKLLKADVLGRSQLHSTNYSKQLLLVQLIRLLEDLEYLVLVSGVGSKVPECTQEVVFKEFESSKFLENSV